MTTASMDEIAIELERAEYDAINALRYWRDVYRMVPRGVPGRGENIRRLSKLIQSLEHGDCGPLAVCCGDPRLNSIDYVRLGLAVSS